MKIRVSVKGDRELRLALERLGPKLKEAVATATARTALRIEEGAKRRAPVNFGHLRTAIRSRFGPEQLSAKVGVFEDAVVNGQQVNYAPYVEFGTRGQPRRFPPIEPLKLWAKRVLGDENLAYPVARKIYERGTAPQPFLGPSFDEHAPGYADEIRKEARTLERP